MQCEDDDHEEFDMKQIIAHAIDKKTEVKTEEKPLPHKSQFTDPAKDEDENNDNDDTTTESNEPKHNNKVNASGDDEDVANKTADTTTSNVQDHEPARQDFQLYSLSSPKATRFQTLPNKNERGEHPPSTDFFGTVKRRVTFNATTNKIIEDADITYLEEHGERNRLPLGVTNIQTHFYFLKSELQGKSKAKYTSVRGDNLKSILKHLGLRQEFGKSYVKYLPPEFVDEAKLPMASSTPYKANKMQFKPGYVFEYPSGRKWMDITSNFFHRQRILNPEWKNTQLAEQAVHDEKKMIK